MPITVLTTSSSTESSFNANVDERYSTQLPTPRIDMLKRCRNVKIGPTRYMNVKYVATTMSATIKTDTD